MFRRAADRSLRGWRQAAVAALAALGFLFTAPGAQGASVSSSQVTGVEMTPQVRQTLKQIEEQWLQWVVQKNPAQAKAAVNDLMSTAHQLGMTRLPDLSAGAVAQAVQAARQKDFDRARWSLDAAEQFDSNRPETAFAEAQVKWLKRDVPGAVFAWLSAYPRLFQHPLERYLWLQNLGVWVLVLLLVSGGLFVAVQMVVRGHALFGDLANTFARRLPRPVALGLAAVVLLWPLVLPFGPLWLALYWSVLLWGYGSASERAVLIALWLLLGVTPLVIDFQRRYVGVELSPPAQAMQSLQQHRLYGSLFSDLGVLRSVLPDNVAVKHLLADVHRSLNQWELARALYRQVLEKEPGNTAALIDLGAYAYLKGDFSGAIQSFQKAAEADPHSAAAEFNLSQAYSDSYLFDESKVALAKAQEIDGSQVQAWMSQSQRVVPVPGGFARIPEIRRALQATWHGGEDRNGGSTPLRRGLSPFVALSLILLAVALHLARRPFGYHERTGDVVAEGAFDRWARVFLPGLASAEIGEGGKSFLAILLITALLMLPQLGKIGVRIPWRYDPGNTASWIVAILGLLLYLGLRLRRELRDAV
ncbi:MAG TPA: tetratricopeptide repeat protein [Thermoanaerobaculia bacterium]|nr:tetratricopeptide repeat protein [Thermoanaerobaculia bacterium]